jgi:hypothetical protein
MAGFFIVRRGKPGAEAFASLLGKAVADRRHCVPMPLPIGKEVGRLLLLVTRQCHLFVILWFDRTVRVNALSRVVVDPSRLRVSKGHRRNVRAAVSGTLGLTRTPAAARKSRRMASSRTRAAPRFNSEDGTQPDACAARHAIVSCASIKPGTIVAL